MSSGDINGSCVRALPQKHDFAKITERLSACLSGGSLPFRICGICGVERSRQPRSMPWQRHACLILIYIASRPSGPELINTLLVPFKIIRLQKAIGDPPRTAGHALKCFNFHLHHAQVDRNFNKCPEGRGGVGETKWSPLQPDNISYLNSIQIIRQQKAIGNPPRTAGHAFHITVHLPYSIGRHPAADT